MNTDEATLQEAHVPRLRVFWGEGNDENGGHYHPDPVRRARQEWMEREAFWAGRNRAERFSARLVA